MIDLLEYVEHGGPNKDGFTIDFIESICETNVFGVYVRLPKKPTLAQRFFLRLFFGLTFKDLQPGNQNTIKS